MIKKITPLKQTMNRFVKGCLFLFDFCPVTKLDHRALGAHGEDLHLPLNQYHDANRNDDVANADDPCQRIRAGHGNHFT